VIKAGVTRAKLAAAARLSTVSFSSAQSFVDQSRQFIHHYVLYNHIIIAISVIVICSPKSPSPYHHSSLSLFYSSLLSLGRV
jgi:hypothetical protein